MNSEQNNSTSFPPTEPELCDNRCGFFVSSNMNLCSKCYRILRAEEDLTAVAKSAVKNSLKLPSCSLIITPEQKQPLETKPASVVVTAEPSSVPIATGQEEAEPSKPARTNRCFSCNKNVRSLSVNYNQHILILLWCCLYKREEIPH
uniref:A20-type domain-containing protein n=1 Tax=Brassica campestris TaxID=3711 RepID=M4E515_BRACM